MWKDVISKLAHAGKFIAEWKLSSGAAFYMYVPAPGDLGKETIKVDSDVRFDELVQLNIMPVVKLGGLTASNDVDACRVALQDLSYVHVSERDGGISVGLK